MLGDFNYPKFSWDYDHFPTILDTCKFRKLYEDVIDLMNEFFEPIEDERSWVDEWKEVNVLWIE